MVLLVFSSDGFKSMTFLISFEARLISASCFNMRHSVICCENLPMCSNSCKKNPKSFAFLTLRLPSYSPVKFVFFLKSRLLFNVFHCLCMLQTNISQSLRSNNSKILRIKNKKFSGCYCYINMNNINMINTGIFKPALVYL